MKKILLILCLSLSVIAETKYYKDSVTGFEVNDVSGLKDIEQLKIEYNSPDLMDITQQVIDKINADKIQTDIDRAERLRILAVKEQEILSNLPTWQQVSDAIDNATTLAQLKAIIKKMARLQYLELKNKDT